jgi:hypothetical protein
MQTPFGVTHQFLVSARGTPRYVLLRFPKFSARSPLAKFRPLPLRLLAASATGGTRKRPHFDTSPYMRIRMGGYIASHLLKIQYAGGFVKYSAEKSSDF